KGHRAARKEYVGLRDLEGELLIMPSKDLLPSLHLQTHLSICKAKEADYKMWRLMISFMLGEIGLSVGTEAE
ncbi:MAG: hypothetical protein WCB11_09170, partial [Terriglobales bacterium]